MGAIVACWKLREASGIWAGKEFGKTENILKSYDHRSISRADGLRTYRQLYTSYTVLITFTCEYLIIMLLFVPKNSLPTTTTPTPVKSNFCNYPQCAKWRNVNETTLYTIVVLTVWLVVGGIFFDAWFVFWKLALLLYLLQVHYLQNNNKHDAIMCAGHMCCIIKYQEQRKKWGCMRVIHY